MEGYFSDDSKLIGGNDAKNVSKIGLNFINGDKDCMFYEIMGYNTFFAHNYIVVEIK